MSAFTLLLNAINFTSSYDTHQLIRLLKNLFLLTYSEYEQIQREEPLKYPLKPPQKRTWRGSTVAPFGGNNALVLYSCSGNNTSEYYVQVLHNEQPIPMAVSSYNMLKFLNMCSFLLPLLPN